MAYLNGSAALPLQSLIKVFAFFCQRDRLFAHVFLFIPASHKSSDSSSRARALATPRSHYAGPSTSAPSPVCFHDAPSPAISLAATQASATFAVVVSGSRLCISLLSLNYDSNSPLHLLISLSHVQLFHII